MSNPKTVPPVELVGIVGDGWDLRLKGQPHEHTKIGFCRTCLVQDAIQHAWDEAMNWLILLDEK